MSRLRVISGDSINLRTVSGWTVYDLPSGETIAEVELDYTEGTDFSWSEEYIGYLRENIPQGVFTTINSCDCRVTDISAGRTYLNSILVAVKSAFNTTQTDQVAIVPLETNQGNANYTTPTKVHALWIVRGITVE